MSPVGGQNCAEVTVASEAFLRAAHLNVTPADVLAIRLRHRFRKSVTNRAVGMDTKSRKNRLIAFMALAGDRAQYVADPVTDLHARTDACRGLNVVRKLLVRDGGAIPLGDSLKNRTAGLRPG